MSNRGLFWKTALILALAWMAASVSPGELSAQTKKQVVLENWVYNQPAPIEVWRLLGEDLEKLGIQVKLTSGTLEQWVGEIVGAHQVPYHTVIMSWGGGAGSAGPLFFSDRVLPLQSGRKGRPKLRLLHQQGI